MANKFERTLALRLILIGTEHVLSDGNLVARQSSLIQRPFGVQIALAVGVSVDSALVQIGIADMEIYLGTVYFAVLHHRHSRPDPCEKERYLTPESYDPARG
jgi:hypothetical protein